jgi:hypothetical protein
MNEDSESGPGRLPVIEGSIYGATGYVAGYLATFVLVVIFEGERFVGDLIEGAGWIFYNAQFVTIEQRTPPGSRGAINVPSINYLTGDGLGTIDTATIVLPAVVYHAIPVVAFVTVGFFLARSFDVSEVEKGAKVGGSIVFGVVILALGGTFVFEVADMLGPNRFRALMIAGLFYPVFCGSVGGAISAWVNATGNGADASKPF